MYSASKLRYSFQAWYNFKTVFIAVLLAEDEQGTKASFEEECQRSKKRTSIYARLKKRKHSLFSQMFPRVIYQV